MIQLPDSPPRAVARAAGVVREREADAAAAKARVEEARTAIDQAVIADREAFASALDAGRGDPGSKAEDAARVGLDDAERRAAVEQIRLGRANDTLTAAINDSIDGWERAARKSLADFEAEVLELADRLAAAEQSRARQRVGLTWLRRYRQAEKLPNLDHTPAALTPLLVNPQAGPQTYDVLALVAGIRAGVEKLIEHERQEAAATQATLHVA